jgi:mRNA interferase MazF
MQKGTLVLLPFPFTDLSGSKVRPALVLHANTLDVTVCFLITQLEWAETFDVSLVPNELNGLKRNSLVRLSKIATLDRKLILGELGQLADVDLIKVDDGLIKMFQVSVR